MKISGRVQNGVVILDVENALPEGAAVTVSLQSSPRIRTSSIRKRVELPIVRSNQPGTLELTGKRLGEILEAEDVAAVKEQWNVPPGR